MTAQLDRLRHWQLGRLRAFWNFVHITRRTMVQVADAGAIGDQPANRYIVLRCTSWVIVAWPRNEGNTLITPSSKCCPTNQHGRTATVFSGVLLSERLEPAATFLLFDPCAISVALDRLLSLAKVTTLFAGSSRRMRRSIARATVRPLRRL
jgi:hypothetical protein